MEKQKYNPNLSRQEIESHSSALFNKRLDEIFRMIIRAELAANSTLQPTIQDVIAYHAALMTLYLETNSAYENHAIEKEINKKVKAGEKVARYLKIMPPNKVLQKDVEWLLQNCKALRYLMWKGLQNLRYFFRFGQQDPKGIGAALELFQQDDWEATGGEKEDLEDGD